MLRILRAALLATSLACLAGAESVGTPPHVDPEVERLRRFAVEYNRHARAAMEIEGLPLEASRTGTVITIDSQKNTIHLFEDGKLVAQGRAATGMDSILRHGKKTWVFRTPRGRHEVRAKIVNPVWTKPDWAFVEEGKPIPPYNSPKRKDTKVMGRYALDLGEGILIHGTDDPQSIGRKASHGCIRLPDPILKQVYKAAKIGTEVHIY